MFALRFLRLLADAEVAADLGPDGCWLLTVVVLAEDRVRFIRQVTFWNRPLQAMSGLSDDRLTRARDRAVRAGFLEYRPGRRGVPGQYRVLVPDRLRGELAPLPVDAPAPALPAQPESQAAVSGEQPGSNRQPAMRGTPAATAPSARPALQAANPGSNPLPAMPVVGQSTVQAEQSASQAAIATPKTRPLQSYSQNQEEEERALPAPRTTVPPTATPETSETSGEAIPPLDVFVIAWNAAGLSPRVPTSHLRGMWQVAWRDFPDFPNRWRAAVEHAGRQRRCRPGGAFPLAAEFFLRDANAFLRVANGEFDDHHHGAAYGRPDPTRGPGRLSAPPGKYDGLGERIGGPAAAG